MGKQDEVKKINLAEAVGRGYRKFWDCRLRYRVVKGGKASKKSTTAALWFIVQLMKYPQSNLLVVRNIFNTHYNSTYAQLKWAINRLGVNDCWKATVSPLELRYIPTGQRILFRGFDDVFKLASTTVDSGYLCWVWVEEAFEIDSQADFDKLDLSVPRGEIPPPLFKQTTLTFNPWDERHWLKKRFFDTESPDVLALTTNYKCNEFLDETDLAVYERLRTENPRRYAVAGLGDWGVSEGLVYERWETAEFVISSITGNKSPDGWKYRHVFGLDYGYTNDPTAFIAMAVNPVDKMIYIYGEHYETRMLNDAIAAMIIAKGFSKERIRADSAEPKSNEDLRRIGITRIISARKGRDSVLNGIAKLQEYRMIVHPSCSNTIAELSSYRWEKSAVGQAQNRPEDDNNHLMDAMRYAMEDILFFRPQKSHNRGRNNRTMKGVLASDFKGGWAV
ncbi:MAG: PBSX family phage terminase large subunit [Oscillospiraceae bacterium]|nr:PBSX family phage terminase large subunit [Oscillospiraceae bacterium]MDD4414070.1 PBSX family phage terminase large subunit [Oscillospiraceae bacterium]